METDMIQYEGSFFVIKVELWLQTEHYNVFFDGFWQHEATWEYE